MKRLRNFFIAMVTAFGITSLYRTTRERKGPLVRALVFHDVDDGEWFRRTLNILKNQYNILTPEAFFAKKYDASRVNVLLTFDDGYASWVEVCLPVLAEERVQGLFFVNSGLLDAHGNTERQARYVREHLLLSPRDTLSWEGARELVLNGHTVGGHGKTHRRLSQLQIREQEEEIRGDKERTEAMLGTTLTAFAYPFGNAGDFTSETEELARHAGYTHIFSTEPAFAEGSIRAPRLCLENGMEEDDLRMWVEGGYDLYAKVKRLCAL